MSNRRCLSRRLLDRKLLNRSLLDRMLLNRRLLDRGLLNRRLLNCRLLNRGLLGCKFLNRRLLHRRLLNCSYTKSNSRLLGFAVGTVENTATAVVGPIYEKFKGVLDDLLVFLEKRGWRNKHEVWRGEEEGKRVGNLAWQIGSSWYAKGF
ncbi:hypothetical protein Tsubulata_025419 [Turnera subulata]|uniref:Uncharacterized protein n=1 Tax=Turnera subulata TaxID=218843 RepID=A0A9Q0JJV0_9ROSI|nr:hypothetical protein Tsubulata_025419 [Turnera subulata]